MARPMTPREMDECNLYIKQLLVLGIDPDDPHHLKELRRWQGVYNVAQTEGATEPLKR